MNYFPQLRISVSSLLWVYTIIPLGILLIIIDIMLGGHIRANTPWTPESYLWYAILFPFPHILISFLSFIDREYINYYKQKLYVGISLILFIAYALPYFSIFSTIVILGFFTIVHVALQQTGIALMFLQFTKNILGQIWKWLYVLSSIIIYGVIFSMPIPGDLTLDQKGLLIEILLSLSWIFTMIILWKKRDSINKEWWYFLLTSLVPIVTYVSVATGYTFIAIMIPRLIHDISALLFYYTHDYYRNLNIPSNMLAKFFSVSPKIFLISMTLLAVGISALIVLEKSVFGHFDDSLLH
jgi:hypothetical protein